MAVARPQPARLRSKPARALLAEDRVLAALQRLGRARALQTLVRGAIPIAALKRLLKDAMPRSAAREVPDEAWAGLGAGIAIETPVFGMPLAQNLHDRLAWDREPPDLEEWWRLVREKPLEALWMAALSESRAVRKEFVHIAEHCLDNYRASPDCPPPSWQFVEALLDLQALTVRDLQRVEKTAEDNQRRYEAERERMEELREELKRLRRETSELRSEKVQAERRAEALVEKAHSQAVPADARRVEELERRLRKTEKEREHLSRELARLTAAPAPAPPATETAGPSAGGPIPMAPAPEAAGDREDHIPVSGDPNPRRRVLRQMLKKLFKKGKIGASHTHEDNVYRGVADHEKGIAKEAMDLLYREGLLVPKPTVTDPHVSLSPERVPEVRAIIAGEIDNTRLLRWMALE